MRRFPRAWHRKMVGGQSSADSPPTFFLSQAQPPPTPRRRPYSPETIQAMNKSLLYLLANVGLFDRDLIDDAQDGQQLLRRLSRPRRRRQSHRVRIEDRLLALQYDRVATQPTGADWKVWWWASPTATARRRN